jgi:hypothetical protein
VLSMMACLFTESCQLSLLSSKAPLRGGTSNPPSPGTGYAVASAQRPTRLRPGRATPWRERSRRLSNELPTLIPKSPAFYAVATAAEGGSSAPRSMPITGRRSRNCFNIVRRSARSTRLGVSQPKPTLCPLRFKN